MLRRIASAALAAPLEGAAAARALRRAGASAEEAEALLSSSSFQAVGAASCREDGEASQGELPHQDQQQAQSVISHPPRQPPSGSCWPVVLLHHRHHHQLPQQPHSSHQRQHPHHVHANSTTTTSTTSSHLFPSPCSAQLQWQRSYAKAASKGGAAGKGGKPAAAAASAAAAPAPGKPAAGEEGKEDHRLRSPLALRKRRAKRPATQEGAAAAGAAGGAGGGPLSLLSAEERAVAAELAPRVSVEGSEALKEGEQQEQGAQQRELEGFGQLGLPVLTPRDTLRLMHQGLSRVVGEEVQLRPFVFESVFQSAPAVAQYVARALESGTSWPRVERFFLSSVEEDRAGVAAIKVQVKGRIGRKASMSGRKVWQQGSLRTGDLMEPLDFGMAQALTRLGVLGVKVWIRYKRSHALPALMPRPDDRPSDGVGGGRARPLVTHQLQQQTSAGLPSNLLADLLATPRTPVPPSPTAWWNVPAPHQPAVNRTWCALAPDFDVEGGVTEAAYRQAHQPLLFMNDVHRAAHLARLGRLPQPQPPTSAASPTSTLNGSSTSSLDGTVGGSSGGDSQR